MSHDNHTKRGFSLHIEKWNGAAKRYINTCAICGRTGYSPVIENDDFEDEVTHRELIKTLPRLELDGLGRCDQCARVQEKR